MSVAGVIAQGDRKETMKMLEEKLNKVSIFHCTVVGIRKSLLVQFPFEETLFIYLVSGFIYNLKSMQN